MRTRAVLAAVIAGITCYYVGALVDFWALTLIDASIERVLLFSYPGDRGAHRIGAQTTRPGGRSGGGHDRHLHRHLLRHGRHRPLASCRQNLFGAALVLIAALTTAIYFLIGERYTHELGSTRFAAIGMSASAHDAGTALRRVSLLRRVSHACRPTTGCCSSSSASFCVFIPGLLQAEGMRRVGAQRAAIGSTIGPPTTIFLAALFLDERLTGWQLLGSAMIIGSVLVLSWPKRVVADEP